MTAGALQSSLAGPQNIFIATINPLLAVCHSCFLRPTWAAGTDSLAGLAVVPLGTSFPTWISREQPRRPIFKPLPPMLSSRPQPWPRIRLAGFSVRSTWFPGSPNTFTLTYSTYLAGNASNGNLTENDIVTGLAVDSSFNAYVTGTTTSTDVITGFPSTPNANLCV